MVLLYLCPPSNQWSLPKRWLLFVRLPWFHLRARCTAALKEMPHAPRVCTILYIFCVHRSTFHGPAADSSHSILVFIPWQAPPFVAPSVAGSTFGLYARPQLSQVDFHGLYIRHFTFLLFSPIHRNHYLTMEMHNRAPLMTSLAHDWETACPPLNRR